MSAYLILVFLIRVSGKRTLAKLNAFDLVVTVALGSLLASTIVSKSSALAEGMLAIAVLVGMQYVIAFFAARSDAFDAMVKNKPTLLVWQGEMLKDVMQKERITEQEVRCAVRESSQIEMEAVVAVVMETTGTLSVITNETAKEPDALKGVSPHPGDQ